jgi:hypothetical protein
MLKESIKAPLFTDDFRLIDFLCQSYPTYVVSSSPKAHFFRENFFGSFFPGKMKNKMNFVLIVSEMFS